MYYYDVIADDGLCIGLSQAPGPISAPNLIPLSDPAASHRGQRWTGAVWEPVVLPPDARLWWIDVGPFKDRLGMDAPAIYASSHSVCKGVVGLLEGRKYVDLRDPRITGMLDVLITTAQPAADPNWPGSGPMTAAKRDAIVNTPTTEDERVVKGLASPP